MLGGAAFDVLFIGLALAVSPGALGACTRLRLPVGAMARLTSGPSDPVFAISGLILVVDEMQCG